jgi:hypothetical protein
VTKALLSPRSPPRHVCPLPHPHPRAPSASSSLHGRAHVDAFHRVVLRRAGAGDGLDPPRPSPPFTTPSPVRPPSVAPPSTTSRCPLPRRSRRWPRSVAAFSSLHDPSPRHRPPPSLLPFVPTSATLRFSPSPLQPTTRIPPSPACGLARARAAEPP